MEKNKLQAAYEAGKDEDYNNTLRNNKLDSGVKQIEEEYSFENWYKAQQANQLTTVGRMAVFNRIVSDYSTLKDDKGIFHAQLFDAMEKYHKEISTF